MLHHFVMAKTLHKHNKLQLSPVYMNIPCINKAYDDDDDMMNTESTTKNLLREKGITVHNKNIWVPIKCASTVHAIKPLLQCLHR